MVDLSVWRLIYTVTAVSSFDSRTMSTEVRVGQKLENSTENYSMYVSRNSGYGLGLMYNIDSR
jgi:hypothetical protein